MNSKMRAKVEADKRQRAQLGAVEYARRKAEAKINDAAKEQAVKIVEHHKELAIHETVKVMQCIMAVVLNNTFDFDAKQIYTVIEKMKLQMGCVTDGHVTGDELVQLCLELGVEV